MKEKVFKNGSKKMVFNMVLASVMVLSIMPNTVGARTLENPKYIYEIPDIEYTPELGNHSYNIWQSGGDFQHRRIAEIFLQLSEGSDDDHIMMELESENIWNGSNELKCCDEFNYTITRVPKDAKEIPDTSSWPTEIPADVYEVSTSDTRNTCFWATGNTWKYGSKLRAEGVLFQDGGVRICYEGAPQADVSLGDNVKPGWYYMSADWEWVYVREDLPSTPAPTNKYTLKIPSSAAASGAGFNAFEEALSITGANMADTKEIVITAEGSEFKCTDSSIKTTIGYEVAAADGNGGVKSIAENGLIVSAADANKGYSKTVGLIVDEASFDNADDGEYTTTIKWTAKVRTAATTN